MSDNILLVDDDKEFRSEFRGCFGEYEITEASTAEEALAFLKKPNKIDLVIMDVQMPGMGGLAAMQKIRELAPAAGIIVMTGFSTKDTAIKALRGRAAAYIEKPFSLKEMRAAIEAELAADLPAADGDLGGRIDRVKRFIEANCFKKITLRDAAAEVFLTPKHLSRVFRQQAGLGFTEYKLKVKVERAQAALRSGDRSIKRLAARLGYANAESFIRQFKKLAGCLPSFFRKAGQCPAPAPAKRPRP